MTKFILSSVLSLAFLFTNAHADEVTQADMERACAQVLSIIPTENGSAITLAECLEFDFSLIEEESSRSIRTIQLIGQTVEDSATVCTVTLLVNPMLRMAVPAPECDLE